MYVELKMDFKSTYVRIYVSMIEFEKFICKQEQKHVLHDHIHCTFEDQKSRRK